MEHPIADPRVLLAVWRRRDRVREPVRRQASRRRRASVRLRSERTERNQTDDPERNQTDVPGLNRSASPAQQDREAGLSPAIAPRRSRERGVQAGAQHDGPLTHPTGRNRIHDRPVDPFTTNERPPIWSFTFRRTALPRAQSIKNAYRKGRATGASGTLVNAADRSQLALTPTPAGTDADRFDYRLASRACRRPKHLTRSRQVP